MKYQAQTSILFLLLCYWSRPPTVSGFTEEQLQRVTGYVQRTFGIRGQHAYAVKFTPAQCAALSENDIAAALNGENIQNVKNAMNSQSIYSGTQMVMATYKDLGNNKREHSEHRLLYPPSRSSVSPAQDLMNRQPAAGCVLFYTYNSPCNAYCTNPNGRFNIVDKLSVFGTNNKAFVFNQVYQEQNINCCHETRLKSVDKQMPLYRCTNNCIKCFNNNRFNALCLRA
ncbi:uncharacterized protein LOC128482812 [Spea bombifrons]|uniref:uncharacterized protein LOC128482812 n=1 Tax=Spea bombifrons TaxID=233779 RepID=UPI00234B12BD|nr:uncharacterized protein LOC128482812 [Spea bombifrons]